MAGVATIVQAAAGSASFIRVRGLTKRFGGFLALDGVSIAEGQGGTLALLGPSGCGKTTMLRCIAGLETPSEGLIEIGGRVVFDAARGIDLKPECRALGVVFQSYAVWPHMTVAANVGFPLRVRGIARADIDARVDRILAMVGLSAWRDRPATELSGGQQQRVALARALIHQPSLVLFDEPMSNLDARLRDQMRLELKLLQQELNFTAIYVTHDQSEAFALAQTVVVMNRGRVEAIAAPEEVARRPATPFIARFLGYNVVDGTVVATASQSGGRGPTGADWVQIAIGPQARLWGRAGPGLSTAKGARAVACVRREHVAVAAVCASEEAAGGAGGRQHFGARLRTASFQGLNQEYMIDVDGAALRAIGAPIEAKVGAEVAVSIARDDCIILPAASGDDQA